MAEAVADAWKNKRNNKKTKGKEFFKNIDNKLEFRYIKLRNLRIRRYGYKPYLSQTLARDT
jgi:hypothetical protein